MPLVSASREFRIGILFPRRAVVNGSPSLRLIAARSLSHTHSLTLDALCLPCTCARDGRVYRPCWSLKLSTARAPGSLPPQNSHSSPPAPRASAILPHQVFSFRHQNSEFIFVMCISPSPPLYNEGCFRVSGSSTETLQYSLYTNFHSQVFAPSHFQAPALCFQRRLLPTLPARLRSLRKPTPQPTLNKQTTSSGATVTRSR